MDVRPRIRGAKPGLDQKAGNRHFLRGHFPTIARNQLLRKTRWSVVEWARFDYEKKRKQEGAVCTGWEINLAANLVANGRELLVWWEIVRGRLKGSICKGLPCA